MRLKAVSIQYIELGSFEEAKESPFALSTELFF